MIAILDYDMGNIGSIQNILKKAGEREVLITREYSDICKADKLILPGVGAFDAGVEKLKKYHLFEVVQEFVLEKEKPVLGICLGMQLLGHFSEEGNKEGLGLLPFNSVRFQAGNGFKVPHMGWDYVNIVKPSKLVKGLEPSQRYYFVHSYYVVCENTENILMTCSYSRDFSAAVSGRNIYGTQFHPEKSHLYGMRLLTNFVKEC